MSERNRSTRRRFRHPTRPARPHPCRDCEPSPRRAGPNRPRGFFTNSRTESSPTPTQIVRDSAVRRPESAGSSCRSTRRRSTTRSPHARGRHRTATNPAPRLEPAVRHEEVAVRVAPLAEHPGLVAPSTDWSYLRECGRRTGSKQEHARDGHGDETHRDAEPTTILGHGCYDSCPRTGIRTSVSPLATTPVRRPSTTGRSRRHPPRMSPEVPEISAPPLPT